MPAPLDLTGRRFGRLVVLTRGERVKWGRWQSSWLCRCDCGAQLAVPQNRLPHRATIPASHRIEACDDCRAHPCAVCGTPIPPPSTSATCSAECAAERRRGYDREWKRAHPPSGDAIRARTARARQKRAQMTPEEREIEKQADNERKRAWVAKTGRATVNKFARERHAERMENPEYRARRREKKAAWQHRNAAKQRAYFREYARKKRARERELELMRTQEALKNDDD